MAVGERHPQAAGSRYPRGCLTVLFGDLDN